jgi:hypothetical protein
MSATSDDASFPIAAAVTAHQLPQQPAPHSH